MISPRRVTVPEFEIASCPRLLLSDIVKRFRKISCPVCHAPVSDLVEHASEIGDDQHLVMEVLET